MMRWCLGVLLLAATAAAITRDQFYPHGHGLDQRLPRGAEIPSPQVTLKVPIVFFGEIYDGVFVNNFGVLTFRADIPTFMNTEFPLPYPSIAVFYTNVDTTDEGAIYYRETNEPHVLSKAEESVQNNFPEYYDFKPTSVFIATWIEVTFSGKFHDRRNSYQVAIISNGTESFVELLYPEREIQWIQRDTQINTLPDAKAQAGFVAEDGRVFTLRGSGSHQIRNIVSWSNTHEPGKYVFRVGNISADATIAVPDLYNQNEEEVEEESKTCVQSGPSVCHIHARCVDYQAGICCQCNEGFYGNGKSCIKDDVPLRVHGKLNGVINDLSLNDVDIQAYVVVADGRAYTALSLVPPSLGSSLQFLSVLGGIVGWLFAKPTGSARNGYQLTGSLFNHTANVYFPATGDRVTVNQEYLGHDVFDQIQLDTDIRGTLPVVVFGTKFEMSEYEELYTISEPGLVRSESTRTYKNKLTGEKYEQRVSQTISYSPCRYAPTSVEVPLTLKVGKIYLGYDKENVVRYGTSNKITQLGQEDPCVNGRNECGPHSSCIPTGDSFTCVCHSGFTDINQDNRPVCVDIDECAAGTHNCDNNADCYNHDGGFQCRCKQGYEGNGINCRKISGCRNKQCDPNAQCVENFGGDSVCVCNSGFESDGQICRPTRENACSICSRYASCYFSEITKNYACICTRGYTGDGRFCVESILESTTTKTPYEAEYNESYVLPHCNEYGCVCPPGYISYRDATSIDLCQLNSYQPDTPEPPRHNDYNEERQQNTDKPNDLNTSDNPPNQENTDYHGNQSSQDNQYNSNSQDNEYGPNNQYDPNSQDNQYGPNSQGNEYNPNSQDNQYSPNSQDTQYGPNSQSNQYNPNSQDNEYGPNNQFDPNSQVNQYGPNSQGNEYNPNSQDNQYSPNSQDTQYGPNSQSNQYNPNSQDNEYGPNNQYNPNSQDTQYGPNSQSNQYNPNSQDNEYGPNNQYDPNSQDNQFNPNNQDNQYNQNSPDGQLSSYDPNNHNTGDDRYDNSSGGDESGENHRDNDGTQSNQENPEQSTVPTDLFIKCESDVECPPNAVCSFLVSANYEYGRCVCPEGYVNVAYECIERTGPTCSCGPNAHCIDTADGERTCICNTRYHGDGYTCKPTSTCFNNSNCENNAECRPDSENAQYTCQCVEGYVKDQNDACILDVTWCNGAACTEHASCLYDDLQNVNYCHCDDGYEGDGINQCLPYGRTCDIANNCSPDALCSPTEGSSYQCVCKEGFTGNGYLCTAEMNCRYNAYLCSPYASCMKRGDDYICECNSGYNGNGSFCELNPRQSGNFLVVSDGASVYRAPFQVTARDFATPFNSAVYQTAVGIDVDCDAGKIYWGDVAGNTIKRASYDGSMSEQFLLNGVKAPEGIAVDWSAKNIFWTDSRKLTIEVANIATKARKVLFAGKGISNPRGIAVHPQRGKIFWSDWNRNGPKIEWASMDGSQRGVLLDSPDVKLPNSLAIDWVRERLCFADAGLNNIKCVSIDTAEQEVIASNCSYPFGLAINGDKFYWSDWKTLKIESIDTVTKVTSQVPIATASRRLYGVAVAPEKCPHATNVCMHRNGNCSVGQLCLPDGRGSRTCVDGDQTYARK